MARLPDIPISIDLKLIRDVRAKAERAQAILEAVERGEVGLIRERARNRPATGLISLVGTMVSAASALREFAGIASPARLVAARDDVLGGAPSAFPSAQALQERKPKEPDQVIGYPDLAPGFHVRVMKRVYISVQEAIYRQRKGEENVEVLLEKTPEHDEALAPARKRHEQEWQSLRRLPDGWSARAITQDRADWQRETT